MIKIIELTSINVDTENQLNVEKVKVYKGYYTINRKSDAEMFNKKDVELVFDGKKPAKSKLNMEKMIF